VDRNMQLLDPKNSRPIDDPPLVLSEAEHRDPDVSAHNASRRM